jgi:cytochrome c556
MVHVRLSMGTCLLVLIALALPLTSAQAQSDEAFIEYRQKVMQSMGANMGATGAILKNKLPFQSHIVHHAYQIQSASQLITAAFKKQITVGKTDAKADIWQDWDKFAAAAKELEEESGKLATVAQSGDMMAIAAQVKAVGKACGGCHKPFRKPKEESYKRQ